MPFDAETEGRKPATVDLHVGGRIRMRRKILGTSQELLADALGITFQQVQKYERGANRVSASKLYEAARALQCSVSYFFDGLPDPMDPAAAAPTENPCLELAGVSEGVELAQALLALDGRQRRAVLRFVQQWAGDEARA